MTSLVTGGTLHIFPTQGAAAGNSSSPCWVSSGGCAPAHITTIFLEQGGGGWIDHQVQPGVPPQPGTMALIVAWQIVSPATLCIASAPLIGDMPSGAPLRHECVMVTKPDTAAPAPLTATVTQGQDSWKGYLAVHAGNEFPPSLTEQYIEMVKVLYGHQIPRWGST